MELYESYELYGSYSVWHHALSGVEITVTQRT